MIEFLFCDDHNKLLQELADGVMENSGGARSKDQKQSPVVGSCVLWLPVCVSVSSIIDGKNESAPDMLHFTHSGLW
jgi:hypothetical protein